MKTNRADLVLVESGLAPTRSQAQLLIDEKVVFYKGNLVKKASEKVSSENLEVRKEFQFVSRGAHKIEGALKDFKVDPKNFIVADVGASTGGFTEYVLSLGAKKVYAIDVGHDQLAVKLRTDTRVVNLEGVNIKHSYELPELVDLAVVDLSFISLRLVLKNIFSLVKAGGEIITLVKPQFEVGKNGLDKNGIVKDELLRLKTVADLKNWCNEEGMQVLHESISSIAGKTGNVEYFFYFKKMGER
jgi:23S rRNA (cytidine1920-2'-O)/16S rRNA (cytidine1409-2'-O)-methyltransferase